MSGSTSCGFRGQRYAQQGQGNGQGSNGQGSNGQGSDGQGQGHQVAPEIATGAAITASLLAGGGLLLLADRLRGKKKSKS